MTQKKKFAAYVDKITNMSDAEVLKEKARLEASIDKHRSNHLGAMLTAIEFWSQRYEFSFQFWGENGNNVFINRDDVEIASFGGHESIMQLLIKTIEWCEKANPRIKFPDGL